MQDRLRIDKHGWYVGDTTLSIPKRVSGSIHRLDVFWQRLKLNPRAVDSITNSDPVLTSLQLLLAYSTYVYHSEQQQNHSSLAQPRIRCVLFLFIHILT